MNDAYNQACPRCHLCGSQKDLVNTLLGPICQTSCRAMVKTMSVAEGRVQPEEATQAVARFVVEMIERSGHGDTSANVSDSRRAHGSDDGRASLQNDRGSHGSVAADRGSVAEGAASRSGSARYATGENDVVRLAEATVNKAAPSSGLTSPPVWCNHAPPYCATVGECQMRRRTDEPTACLPAHDDGPALRSHGTPGWWQVWSGGICVALLRPEDADVMRRETIEECATWAFNIRADEMPTTRRGVADAMAALFTSAAQEKKT